MTVHEELDEANGLLVVCEDGLHDLADELLLNSRPAQLARDWLAEHPELTATWEIAGERLVPRPLDDGARKLVERVRGFTDCARTLAETVAHLFDHAEICSRALWCWREGDREFIRIEPRPVWAVS